MLKTATKSATERKVQVLDERIKEAYKGNYLSVVDRLLEERYRLVNGKDEEEE